MMDKRTRSPIGDSECLFEYGRRGHLVSVHHGGGVASATPSMRDGGGVRRTKEMEERSPGSDHGTPGRASCATWMRGMIWRSDCEEDGDQDPDDEVEIFTAEIAENAEEKPISDSKKKRTGYPENLLFIDCYLTLIYFYFFSAFCDLCGEGQK